MPLEAPPGVEVPVDVLCAGSVGGVGEAAAARRPPIFEAMVLVDFSIHETRRLHFLGAVTEEMMCMWADVFSVALAQTWAAKVSQ